MALQIRCFPADDTAFRKTVGKALRGMAFIDEEQLATDAIRALDHLRPYYPMLRIRVADRLALTADDPIVYVFRDGHALPSVNEGPGTMRLRSPLAQAVVRAAESVHANAGQRDQARKGCVAASVALARYRGSGRGSPTGVPLRRRTPPEA
jgi:hypothetical protein